LPESKAKKNLQFRPDDELLKKFQAAQRLLGMNDMQLVKYSIEFTLKYIAEHSDEYIAERRREHEKTMRELELAIKEVREILAD
jgi:hypothetical protein